MPALERRHMTATVGGSVLALIAGAGAAAVAHVAPHVAGFDWTSWTTQLISIVLPTFGVVATFYARQLVTSTPKWLLPFAGIAFATAGDQLAAWVSTHQSNVLLATLYGALVPLLYDAAKEFIGDQA